MDNKNKEFFFDFDMNCTLTEEEIESILNSFQIEIRKHHQIDG